MKKPILKADKPACAVPPACAQRAGKCAAGRPDAQYQAIFGDVSRIVDAARRSAARSVNAAMTAAYWLIGQRVVEFEQSGEKRAEYGTALIKRLAADLTQRFGHGFSRQNIQQMRQFYLSYPPERIRQTASGKFDTTSTEVRLRELFTVFPLPWSAYVRLLLIKKEHTHRFCETETCAVISRDSGGTRLPGSPTTI